MSQQDLTQRAFWPVLSYGLLAAFLASLAASATRLFLIREECWDFCDLPGKLFVLPILGILATVFAVPVVLAVGLTCAIYLPLAFSKYGDAAMFPLPLITSALFVLYGLIWFFPILQLGNLFQTRANAVQWTLTAILTGLLFRILTYRRLHNAIGLSAEKQNMS